MLRCVDVSHAYDSIQALRGVNLALGANEILCLLGPSGCGKTTLLRIVAGLISDYTGLVEFDGGDLRGLPAHRRGFGMVFQDFALFPHMSVAENIAYGLRRKGIGKGDIDERVVELLARVDLAGYGARDIATLSGGEMQRVALARSLAPNPRLLMLDEPLGSLDARLRDELALYLRRIIKEAGVSAIVVTHDHREAYAMADRIAVMRAGTALQIDRPRQLYQAPSSAFVARFLGLANVFRFDANPITRQIWRERHPAAAADAEFLIHPDGVSVDTGERDALTFLATAESLVFRGEHSEIHLRLDAGMALLCRSRDATLAAGDAVIVHISKEAIRLFD